MWGKTIIYSKFWREQMNAIHHIARTIFTLQYLHGNNNVKTHPIGMDSHMLPIIHSFIYKRKQLP